MLNKKVHFSKYMQYKSLALIYCIFTFYASLCMLKISMALPTLLSKEYQARFTYLYRDNAVYEVEGFINKNGLLFSNYVLYNLCFLVILLYIISPLLFNFYLHNNNAILELIAKGKKLYISTLVCWGVVFSIFLAVAILLKE